MLKQLEVEDFTVFTSATFEFGALNVIHGENSSGKTHVLKLAYSLLASMVPGPNEAMGERPTKAALESRLGAKLVGVFRPDQGKLGRLTRRVRGTKTAKVRASFDEGGALSFSFSARSDRAPQITSVPPAWLVQTPVFSDSRAALHLSRICQPLSDTGHAVR